MTDKMKKSFEDQFGKEFMDAMYDMGFEEWMDNEREKDPMLRLLEELEKEFAEELEKKPEKKPEKKEKEKLAIPLKKFFDETKSLPDEFWESLREITDIPEHAYSIVINFDKDGIYIMDEDNTILYDDMDEIDLSSVNGFAVSISYLLYDFIRENFHD